MKSEVVFFFWWLESEPLSLFDGIQLQWLESIGHFTPSDEAKSASLSGVPMSKDSERATFAFYRNPATVARMFGGFASSQEAKSASRSEAPSTSHSERATFAF